MVVENTISIEKTSQIARLCHQQMPHPQNVLSQIATKLQNSQVFSYIVYGTMQKCKVQYIFWHKIIEMSLSEPHTSVAALQDVCVCLRPYTENEISHHLTKRRWIY